MLRGIARVEVGEEGDTKIFRDLLRRMINPGTTGMWMISAITPSQLLGVALLLLLLQVEDELPHVVAPS